MTLPLDDEKAPTAKDARRASGRQQNQGTIGKLLMAGVPDSEVRLTATGA
jgi:hypothetical protein